MPLTMADDNSSETPRVTSMPGIGTQAQTIADPLTGWRMPNTAASETLPVSIRMPSSSVGPVRLPEILMATSDRPRTEYSPSWPGIANALWHLPAVQMDKVGSVVEPGGGNRARIIRMVRVSHEYAATDLRAAGNID